MGERESDSTRAGSGFESLTEQDICLQVRRILQSLSLGTDITQARASCAAERAAAYPEFVGRLCTLCTYWRTWVGISGKRYHHRAIVVFGSMACC